MHVRNDIHEWGGGSNTCAEFIFNGMRDFEVRIVIRDGKFLYFIYLFKKDNTFSRRTCMHTILQESLL